MKSLTPPTADRSAQGKAERKLDLANRLQDASDAWLDKGNLDLADLYQDLSAEALADYHEMTK